MQNMNRRDFLSTGASLVATGASLLMVREATAAPHDAAHDSMGESTGLSRPPSRHVSEETLGMEGRHTSEEMQRCIQLCHDCHALCVQMIGYCLRIGGRYAAPDHIRLLTDCAQMCATTADYMARESSFHDRTCGLCAEICRRCADHCERTGEGDQRLAQCAELCLRCAESCQRMASNGTA